MPAPDVVWTCPRCQNANPAKKIFCGDCGLAFDPVSTAVQAYLDANLKPQIDGVVKDRFRDQSVVETQVAGIVTEKVVGWTKLLALVLGAMLAVAASILGFKVTQVNDLEASLSKSVADAATTMKQQIQQSSAAVDRFNQDLADKQKQIANQIDANKNESLQNANEIQREKKGASETADELKKLRAQTKDMSEAAENIRNLQKQLRDVSSAVQARASVDIRSAYNKLAAAAQSGDPTTFQPAIANLRAILGKIGKPPPANATAQDLLSGLRQAMSEAAVDTSKLYALAGAIEAADVR